MGKLFFTAVIVSLAITSCSDKKNTEEQSKNESNLMLKEPQPIDSASIATKATPISIEAEGKALVEGAACLSCHKVDSKLVGPAYQDVAEKYTDADIDHLATKIIQGGQGVWGDIPMAPSTGLSKENAQKMVKYILSLKKE